MLLLSEFCPLILTVLDSVTVMTGILPPPLPPAPTCPCYLSPFLSAGASSCVQCLAGSYSGTTGAQAGEELLKPYIRYGLYCIEGALMERSLLMEISG